MAHKASGQAWTARFKHFWSDPVGSKLIANLIWAGLVLVALGFVQWQFGARVRAAVSSPKWWSVAYDRQEIALWVILPAAVVLIAAWFIARKRGYKAGHSEGQIAGTRTALAMAEGTGPTEVLATDKRCGLFWRVKGPLHDILSLDVSGASPMYLRSIVDGPFHSRHDCHERMRLWAYDGGDEWPMLYRCQHCDKGGEADLRDVDESTVTHSLGDVIRELQRLARLNGGVLEPDDGRIQLQRPLYWERVDARRSKT
jgi:hypothetical protein